MRKAVKSIGVLYLFVCLLLSFTACGGNKSSNSHSTHTTNALSEDLSSTDASFSNIITGITVSESDATESTTVKYIPPSINGILFHGALNNESALIERSYEAPRDGIYRFDFKLTTNANARFSFTIIDSTNAIIVERNGISNANGVTRELKGGETYIFQFKQQTDFSEFDMTIGVPHPTVTLTENSKDDEITYKDQCNHYIYTAPISGKYRFQCNPSDYTVYYYLSVTDIPGVEKCNSQLQQLNGKTVYLDAGQTYNIVISQYGDNDNECHYTYNLTVFTPTEPQTVKNRRITGDLTFIEQENIHYFSIPSEGKYRFSVETSDAEAEFYILVRNEKKVVFLEKNHVRNEYTYETDLKAGNYTVFIDQQNNFCSYIIKFERI